MKSNKKDKLATIKWKLSFLEKLNSPEMKNAEERYWWNMACYACKRFDLMKI